MVCTMKTKRMKGMMLGLWDILPEAKKYFQTLGLVGLVDSN